VIEKIIIDDEDGIKMKMKKVIRDIDMREG